MKTRSFARCSLVVCCLLLCGCGNPLRQEIGGTVTLNGQPMPRGHIAFRPCPGTPGPTAGADIVDGRFTILSKGGTFAGEFRVEITSSRPSKKKVRLPETGELVDTYEQFLPAKYNTQTELRVKVQSNATNHFEFAVATLLRNSL